MLESTLYLGADPDDILGCHECDEQFIIGEIMKYEDGNFCEKCRENDK